MPPLEVSRVDSVTVTVVGEIAAARGIALQQEWATPAELAGTTVWALNSLHGIRQVTQWVGEKELKTQPDRLTEWRALYAAVATETSPR